MSQVRPKVLWIVTTQWRAQATGYAGDPNATTPFLDAWAKTGTNFASAVTPHPFGPFARAALLTGTRCPANGVRDYFDPLPVGTRTIAHDMTERGYRTAWFGKWHLAQRSSADPLVGDAHARVIVPAEARGGFDFWEGFESGFVLNDPWLHGTRIPQPQRFSGYQSDVLCDRAAAWLADERLSAGSAPWFCVVSLEAPHPPYDAPAADVPPRSPQNLELSANVPRGGDVEARARRELAGYYSHIEATDCAIGRLISTLAEDTIVVLTSVHGDMHGAHGLFRKGWPHEESIRVPLLIRSHLPDRHTPSNLENDAPVSLLDLPAMTRAWADGQSWAGRANYAIISMPSVVDLPDQCDRVWRGIKTSDWKVVLQADESPWLVFNLREDPGETRNLVGTAEGETILRSMRGYLQAAPHR